jgi:hypothetical protein
VLFSFSLLLPFPAPSLRATLPRNRGVRHGSGSRNGLGVVLNENNTPSLRPPAGGGRRSGGTQTGLAFASRRLGLQCQSRPSAGRSSALALSPVQQQGLPDRPSRPLACRTTLDSLHCHWPKMLRIFLDLRFFYRRFFTVVFEVVFDPLF